MAARSEQERLADSLEVIAEVHDVLDPTHRSGKEVGLDELSQRVIRGMTRAPQLAEAMLVPLARAAVFESDDKVRGEVVKALGVIRAVGPEGAVEEAVRQAARLEGFVDGDGRTPEEVIDAIRETHEFQTDTDVVLDYLYRDTALYDDGRLNMKAWSRASFLDEVFAVRVRDENFKRFKRRDPVAARGQEEQFLAEAEATFEWLTANDGIVPKQWERTDAIIEDLRDTRGYEIPQELVDAAIKHPSPKVAKAVAKHQRLNGNQKAALVLRGEVNLGHDPGSTLRRWDMDLHLMRRRRALDKRK
jgi:hypothetical protein